MVAVGFIPREESEEGFSSRSDDWSLDIFYSWSADANGVNHTSLG